MADEPTITLREYLEKLHDEYVSAHTREHVVHADAHAREHALNKEAISKAETSVDKAVSAARETVGSDLAALVARLDRSDVDYRNQMDEIKGKLGQMDLDVASIRTSVEGSSKLIQALQDSQTWIVRLIVGAIVLAILAWIVRPAVF